MHISYAPQRAPNGSECYNPRGFTRRAPRMMRFDRFTERAQDAAQRSAEIIQRYGHNQIDTEHLLLALLEQPEALIPQILERLTVNADQLAQRIARILRARP